MNRFQRLKQAFEHFRSRGQKHKNQQKTQQQAPTQAKPAEKPANAIPDKAKQQVQAMDKSKIQFKAEEATEIKAQPGVGKKPTVDMKDSNYRAVWKDKPLPNQSKDPKDKGPGMDR